MRSHRFASNRAKGIKQMIQMTLEQYSPLNPDCRCMGKILDVTMADVGRAAGGSQTAVSLAMRRDASIPPKTRDRILSVARRL